MFSNKTVYLAGPITGLSYDEARLGWRTEFASLMPEHIKCASPMRAKQFLSEVVNLSGSPDSNPENAMSLPSGINTRDRNDVFTSDAVVYNFLGASIASVGSCIEVGWADAWRKPMVMIVEDGGMLEIDKDGLMLTLDNPHWHCMVNDLMGYVVHDLDEAAHIVTHLLTPGV